MRRSSVAISLLTAMLASEVSISSQDSRQSSSSANRVKVELAENGEDEQFGIARDSRITIGKELSE